MKPILLSLSVAFLSPGISHGDEVLFQDNFSAALSEGWTWIREDADAWRVTDGALEIRTQPGNMWGPDNNAKNVLVRSAPDPQKQEIEVSVTVENRPTAQYEQADLVWYYDDSHMVKLGQELIDGNLSLVMGREEGDRAETIVILPIGSPRIHLKFRVQGDQIQGQYRETPDGEWSDAGQCTLPVHGAPKVSLHTYQGPADEEHWVRFTDFLIRKLQ